MISLPRLPGQSQHLLAIGSTLLLHTLLIGYLLQQEFDEPPPEPKVRSIQMRFVSVPAVPAAVVEPPAVSKPGIAPPVQPPEKTVQKALPVKAARPETVKQQVQKLKQPVEVSTAPAASKPAQAELSQAASHKATDVSASASNNAHAGKATTTESNEDKGNTNKQVEVQVQAAQAASESAFDVKNFQPVYKQKPEYPSAAVDQGLEGNCTISFTVNAQGRVENPQPESDCHPLFVRPALNAVKNFKYQPRVVNGQAVAVQHVRNVFQFSLAGQ